VSFAAVLPSAWRLGNELDDRGSIPGRGCDTVLLATASTSALGPTQPPIQWIPGVLSLRIKRPGREADHSPPHIVETNNAWTETSTFPIRLHGVVLG
jgi:hypothetical protein